MNTGSNEFKQWQLNGDYNFAKRNEPHKFRVRCNTTTDHCQAVAAADTCGADDIESLFADYDDNLQAIAYAELAPSSAARETDTQQQCNRAVPGSPPLANPAVRTDDATYYEQQNRNADLQVLIRNVSKFAEVAEKVCKTMSRGGCIGFGTTQPAAPQQTRRHVTIQIFDDVREWLPSERDLGLSRLTWPIEVGRNVKNTDEFKAIMLRTKEPETAAVYVSATNMFTSCMTSEEGDESLLELIIHGYKQNRLEELWALPLFNDVKSFGIKISQALQVVVEQLRISANRSGDRDLSETLQLFIDDFLEPLATRNTQKKELLKKAKDNSEKKTISNSPPPELMKDVCRNVMFMLHLLVETYKYHDSLTPSIRFIANCLMF